MLVNLSQRSNEQELMDDPNVDATALKIALLDISRVNRLLGGNDITINGVLELIKTEEKQKEYTILDLGCGDGEMLRKLAVRFKKNKIQAKFVGIDLNEKCLEHARQLSTSFPEITYCNQNILMLDENEFHCDIIISTLTLHHLKDNEIKVLLQKMTGLAAMGVIINDLQRSTIAYYLFKVFSFFFIKGHIAKNDGLVSIKRGFVKKELEQFSRELSMKNYNIDWKWAFRYKWVLINENK